ncbi:unnamed protein product [Peronospora belbahrii]|uniref:Uncharacterized protein n=1 Tax=Peronospora belbahrii TaxID=622444 RepID=A0AAU9LJE3_9STRA|nr:unnamed protein product [Peronospora belbahrii]CAH0518944.1 unnamed protein product [Peronospora belbahrii]
MVVIIIVAVMFVAVTSWVIRWYCMRRLKAKSKLRSRRNRSIHAANIQATSPSNTTGRSSGTPSFPAFDRRTRGIQSPVTGERGRGNQDVQHGRLTPRSREQTSARGRRNPDLEFASNRTRQTSREHDSRRGKRALNLEGGRREPGSGRRWQTPDTNFVPNGPRSHKEAGMQYEPNSGRSRRDTYKMCKAETVTRNPTSNDAAPSSSGTVYTGRNTYERVAQFAQLAAFEAPSPSPVRPQRPIQSIPVSDAVPKHIRAPAQNARPAPSAPSMPKRTEYYIEESPVAADYDILSPKTARSLASVASSATTVVVPGRNRPTALQQGRRPQHAPAVASYYQPGYSVDDAKSFGGESRFSESKYDESGFGNKQKAPGNYLDSFMSKDSSMAWSRASGLSDDSYYLAPPTNLACIPVIEAPREDDDALSEDAYSDWGHSTHQTSDDFRSTAASYSAKDASFFSVNSDFSDSSSMFKEREF